MSLIRLILVFLVAYLTFRSFALYEAEKKRKESSSGGNYGEKKKRKVPGDVGEYVDYEEIKD